MTTARACESAQDTGKASGERDRGVSGARAIAKRRFSSPVTRATREQRVSAPAAARRERQPAQVGELALEPHDLRARRARARRASVAGVK